MTLLSVCEQSGPAGAPVYNLKSRVGGISTHAEGVKSFSPGWSAAASEAKPWVSKASWLRSKGAAESMSERFIAFGRKYALSMLIVDHANSAEQTTMS
jgi:hypothetical protein